MEIAHRELYSVFHPIENLPKTEVVYLSVMYT